MLLNGFDLPDAGWNDLIVSGVLQQRIAIAYRVLFTYVNTLCMNELKTTVPILVHGYDHPVPDGRGFLGGWGPLPGPWLKPGFDEKRFPQLFPQNTGMMADIIDRFNDMLAQLAADPAFPNVVYVDLRGTLTNGANYKDDWANELHPTGGELFESGDGFSKVAARFQAELIKLPLVI